MSESLSTVSTLAKWLFILVIVALSLSFMWEIAKNLWLNWGTSSFWASSLVAALVGMLGWWLIGLVAYLSTPKTARGIDAERSPVPVINQSATASGGSTINQAGRDNITININRGTSQEVIEGTNVTNAQLKSAFPFGYVVFSSRDGRWQYSPLPSDKMEYTADWGKVRITPNFVKKIMKWTIPELNSTNLPTAQIISSDVENAAIPLNEKEICRLAGFINILDQPQICLGTLNDNQKVPVFVLGFRILSEEESNSGCFAAPWVR